MDTSNLSRGRKLSNCSDILTRLHAFGKKVKVDVEEIRRLAIRYQ